MKTYFKFLLALYLSALVVGGACRILLKLWYMDLSTGFYAGGELYVFVFNIALFTVPVILFATNRLKRPDDDYPVESGNSSTSLLAALTGLSILAFAFIGPPESNLNQGYGAVFSEIKHYILLVSGVLSGIAFLYFGISGMLGRRNPPFGAVIIIPAVWQVVSLITRYNAYTTVTAISDHLLVVMFMIFNALFLVGQARTVCMQMRKDGRNYAIPAGLCTSLCGLFLVVPNYVYMTVHGTTHMPVALLGLAESVYVLVMSLYALCFAVGLMRSIRKA